MTKLIVFTALIFTTAAHAAVITPLGDRTKLLCEMKQQQFVGDFTPALAGALPPPVLVTPPPETVEKAYLTPTVLVAPVDWPDITDDLDLADLKTAIDRQLEEFAHRELTGTIQFGADVYPLTQAQKSLQALRTLVTSYNKCRTAQVQDVCETRLTVSLQKKFNLYRPQLDATDPHFGEEQPGLFTGYYTPLLHATSAPSIDNTHAIYAEPSTDNLRTQTREAIDFEGALANMNLELAYSLNLFDLYLMQIQGSGHILIDDATDNSFFADYQATNSQPLHFISIYMKNMGYIDDVSIDSQRSYLTAHPEKEQEIYATCPSYVYFRKTSELPTGSGGAPVTGNRSVATDDRYYPFKGIIAFVSSQRPDPNQERGLPCVDVAFQPFSRIFLDQDTGGAVRGKDRADIYFGEGDYAEFAASNEAERGDIYFFMLKQQ